MQRILYNLSAFYKISADMIAKSVNLSKISPWYPNRLCSTEIEAD